MMFPILFGAAFVYVVVASWAVGSGGVRRLWTVAAGAVAVLAALGTAVGRWYAVPSLPLLLLYVALLFGPMVVVTALALTPAAVRTAAFGQVLALAALGAMLGLAIGFFAAVYGVPFAAR